MSVSKRGTLNAARTRARKYNLALRDGRHCTYCRRPFIDLRDATLDHVVPLSLFRTWSAAHLVLACRPCNQAKADRLPLSLVLLLIWSADSSGSTDPTGWGPESADWPLLARLAHANHSADRSPDPDPIQSTCDLRPVRTRTAHLAARTRLCAAGRTAA